jgi:FAD dependent oxidoreductase TIGR03364
VETDDLVVGAGIMGLACAWRFARAGRRVAVLERDPRARGASIRNFGLVWPIGQPPGPSRELALESATLWREVLDAGGFWHARGGALFAARTEEEERVVREFAGWGPEHGYDASLLDPRRARAVCPALRRDGLRAALLSHAEFRVDPRALLAGLPAFLARTHGVTFHWNEPVVGVEPGRVRSSRRTWRARRVWICSGDETRLLFPDRFEAFGARPVQLQMLRARPAADAPPLPCVVAGGPSLVHYPAFARCPGLPALAARIARERPEWEADGIHVMAAQGADGSLLLGDSHRDADEAGPFEAESVFRRVLHGTDELLELGRLHLLERWHGVYLKHPERAATICEVAPGVTICGALGGAGMTLAFGLAERLAENPGGLEPWRVA